MRLFLSFRTHHHSMSLLQHCRGLWSCQLVPCLFLGAARDTGQGTVSAAWAWPAAVFLTFFLWVWQCTIHWTSQVAPVVKNLYADAGNLRNKVSIPGSGRPLCRRAWQPTPLFLPGRISQVEEPRGATVHGVTESDVTEVTWHTCTHVPFIVGVGRPWLEANNHLKWALHVVLPLYIYHTIIHLFAITWWNNIIIHIIFDIIYWVPSVCQYSAL